jgi:single-stranded DNA-binding protein
MADNSTPVSGLTVSVVSESTFAESAKGTPYCRFKGVHDGDEKVWFSAVAFGPVAKGLHSLVKKGTKLKVNGAVSQKEYQKKDGGVGIENKLVIKEAKVATSKGVVEVDDFYEPPKSESSPF